MKSLPLLHFLPFLCFLLALLFSSPPLINAKRIPVNHHHQPSSVKIERSSSSSSSSGGGGGGGGKDDVIPVVDPSYRNYPIAPAYWNLEVEADGMEYPTFAGQRARPSNRKESKPTGIGGEFLVERNSEGLQKVKIAGGRGWCKTNQGCEALLEPNEGGNNSARVVDNCFSQFYVTAPEPGVFVKRTSLDTPTTDIYNFSRCNGANQIDFSSYSMTYYARLLLIDLDLNASRVIGDDPRCENLFPDLCYLQMWSQNIKNGFLCNNADEPLVNYRGASVTPPCRSFCHRVLKETCPGFASSVLREGETITQFCDVFPTYDCQSAAYGIKPDSYAVVGLFVISLIVKLLWR